MNIELELRLEGQDANEDTLLDLMDWLEHEDIHGLRIQRKKSPLVTGYMGASMDNFTVVMFVSMQNIDLIVSAWHHWYKARGKWIDIFVEPKIIKSDNPDITTETIKQKFLSKMKNNNVII